VVRAAPDGYTLLLVTAGNAINTSFYRHLDFNFTSDIAPVAPVGRTPFVMVVNPTVPAKTVGAFITYARANPGKINLASPGIGGANHIFGELFELLTGVRLVHVPRRGLQPETTIKSTVGTGSVLGGVPNRFWAGLTPLPPPRRSATLPVMALVDPHRASSRLPAAAKRWRPTSWGSYWIWPIARVHIALRELVAMRPMPVGIESDGAYFIKLPGRRRLRPFHRGSDDNDGGEEGDEPDDDV
jgi:hypothetical protein